MRESEKGARDEEKRSQNKTRKPKGREGTEDGDFTSGRGKRRIGEGNSDQGRRRNREEKEGSRGKEGKRSGQAKSQERMRGEERKRGERKKGEGGEGEQSI